jgi:sugar-specific transcriptional regulator TrmB
MKWLIAVVLIAVVALVAYNYGKTGEIRLLPPRSAVDDFGLGELERQFEATRRQAEELARAAGKAGEDAADKAARTRRELERLKAEAEDTLRRIEKEAKAQKGRAEDAVAQGRRELERRAEQLKAAIEAFERELERRSSGSDS